MYMSDARVLKMVCDMQMRQFWVGLPPDSAACGREVTKRGVVLQRPAAVVLVITWGDRQLHRDAYHE
jgi:hypothetical protein